MNKIMAVINSWEHAEHILSRAKAVAAARACELFVYCPVASEMEEMNRYIGFDNFVQLQNELLNESRERLQALPGVEVYESLVEWQSKPYRAVADKAEAIGAEMIVMSVCKHSIIGDFLHKPDDWHLLRDAPCPILVLGAKQRQYRGVAVAVDVLDDSDDHQSLTGRILDEAKALANTLALPLKLVSVIPDPAYLYSDISAAGNLIAADFNSQAKEKILERQQTLLERYGIQADAAEVLQGAVDSALQEVLSELGVLVIGTIANKGMKGFFLGNTSERLLQHLEGDMLVVN